MIAYYLGEKPILDNVPTYPCVDPERRAEVLDRLDELVLKPVNGYGGKGIVIGPHAERGGARRGRGGDPRRAGHCGWRRTWCRSRPTRRSSSGRLEPRAVDLRVFVLQSRRGSDHRRRRAARGAEPGRAGRTA